MSDNPVQRSTGPLVRQTQKGIGGAQIYGDTLPLSIYTAAVLTALLASLQQKNAAYRAAGEAKKSATAELQRAVASGREFASTLADVFRPLFGRTWNRTWEQLGFMQPSLRVPQVYDALNEV